MPVITYQTSGKSVEVPVESNLLRSSIRYQGNVPFKCGAGLCGTCKVRIVEGYANLSPVGKKEIQRLGQEKIDEGYRLACQTFIHGDVTVAWGDEDLARFNQYTERRMNLARR
jgi:ferredoxin